MDIKDTPEMTRNYWKEKIINLLLLQNVCSFIIKLFVIIKETGGEKRVMFPVWHSHETTNKTCEINAYLYVWPVDRIRAKPWTYILLLFFL